MDIVIESANKDVAQDLREDVFAREWGLRLPSLSEYSPEDSLTVVARCLSTQNIVAALTAVETTNDHALHRRVSLDLVENSHVARYTQLAVRKPYRGLNLPMHLILEAQRRFVHPRGIEHSWLLFNAERATSSSLCRVLGYEAGPNKLWTEYGRSRLLMRRETGAAAEASNERARAYLGVFAVQDVQVRPSGWIPDAGITPLTATY